MEELRSRIASQAERLEQFPPLGIITVKIDGKEVADFNLDTTNRVDFIVDDDAANRIEIIALGEQGIQSEPLVLAIHLLDYEVWETQSRKCIYSVRHKNGAKITFTFRSERTKLFVTVSYEETSVLRVLALVWRRLKMDISSWQPRKVLFLGMKAIEDTRQPARSKPRIYAGAIISKIVVATLVMFISSGTYLYLLPPQQRKVEHLMHREEISGAQDLMDALNRSESVPRSAEIPPNVDIPPLRSLQLIRAGTSIEPKVQTGEPEPSSEVCDYR